MRKAALLLAGVVVLSGCGSQSTQDSLEASGDATRSGVHASTTPEPKTEPAEQGHRRADDDGPHDSAHGRGHDGDAPTRAPHHRRSATDHARGDSPQTSASGITEQRTRRHRAPRHRVPRHRVLEVVDGDTVKVAYRGEEVSVRVIGIDTPETVHPSVPVECGGPQASATAKRLLTGKRVRLVFDPSQGRTDYYGRTLAYLQAPGVGDFGLAMIRRGKAAEYTYDTAYARQSRYQRAEANAQAHDRGVWGKCGGVDTPLVQPAPAPAAKPRAHDTAPRGGNCDPGYDPCIPPYPPDLDCGDVDGPVRVTGDDPHGFDADGDGIGCDS